MFIPVIDSVLEMNPTEFEKYALQILQDHMRVRTFSWTI